MPWKPLKFKKKYIFKIGFPIGISMKFDIHLLCIMIQSPGPKLTLKFEAQSSIVQKLKSLKA